MALYWRWRFSSRIIRPLASELGGLRNVQPVLEEELRDGRFNLLKCSGALITNQIAVLMAARGF